MDGVSGKFWQNGTIGLTSKPTSSHLASIELPFTSRGTPGTHATSRGT